jgi:hypothetical protein
MIAMKIFRRSPVVAVSLGVLAATSIACAHGPAPVETRRSEKAAAPEKIFVTGSHIARRVDPTSGLPLTTSSVRIYSREQLVDTGRQGNLDAALRAATPLVSP